MFSLKALSEHVDAYKDRRIDLDSFEEWFRANSWGWYSRSGEALSDAIAAVDFALSAFDSGEIDEASLCEELTAAVRPFALGPVYARPQIVEIGKPMGESLVANPAFRLELSVPRTGS